MADVFYKAFLDMLERSELADKYTGNASCISVSKDTYEELRNKLSPANILYDEETGREMLKPPVIFLSILT